MLFFVLLLLGRHNEIQILESKDTAFHTTALIRADRAVDAPPGLGGDGVILCWLFLLLLDWHDGGCIRWVRWGMC